MTRHKLALGLLAATTAMTLPSVAQAAIVVSGSTEPGSAWTILYDQNYIDGTESPGVSATLNLTLASVVGTVFTFNYALFNTSVLDSRITGFGFSTDPDITDSNVISGPFSTIVALETKNNGTIDYPAFPVVGEADLCLTNGGNSCQGGGNGGVDDGETGLGSFSLTFASATDPITFDGFKIRYQSIVSPLGGSGSGLSTGGGSIGNPNPPGAVPEPATWMMMLFGFGAVGYSMRRRSGVMSNQSFA